MQVTMDCPCLNPGTEVAVTATERRKEHIDR